MARRAATDQLYGVPLSEFVRERNALAAWLRKSGQASDAVAVARLPKPSLPLWTVNQLPRRNAARVARLVDAVERLHRAQIGRGGEVGDASKAQREALRELLDDAKLVVKDAGARPTDQTLARISATLLGAAADRDVREDLRAGRLAEERAAPGFEVFGAAAPRLTLVKPAPRSPERPARSSGARDDERAKRAAERDARRDAKMRARDAERRTRELERSAARQQREADEATAEADKLRQRLVELDRRAGEARRAAERARQAARDT
jgi:hypothetical protein